MSYYPESNYATKIELEYVTRIDTSDLAAKKILYRFES